MSGDLTSKEQVCRICGGGMILLWRCDRCEISRRAADEPADVRDLLRVAVEDYEMNIGRAKSPQHWTNKAKAALAGSAEPPEESLANRVLDWADSRGLSADDIASLEQVIGAAVTKPAHKPGCAALDERYGQNAGLECTCCAVEKSGSAT